MATRKRLSLKVKISQTKISDRNEKAKIQDAIEFENDIKKLKILFQKVRNRKGSGGVKVSNRQLKIKLLAKILELTFPPHKKRKFEIIDLRKIWIEATSKNLKYLNKRLQDQLDNNGYLGAMSEQIKTIDKIGTGNFKNLTKMNLIHLTSEFIFYNYYDSKLSKRQRDTIRDLLVKKGCSMSKSEFENEYRL